MAYELWSLTSRNRTHGFETGAAAVEAVRTYVEGGALRASNLVVYGDDDVPTDTISGPEHIP